MFITAPPDSAENAQVYVSSASSFGFVMNMAKAWAWRPDFFEGFVALRSGLTQGSALSKRDVAVLVCATASALRDSYCSLAWGDVLSELADAEVAAALLTARHAEGITARDAALADWARKVVVDPNGTTQADVDALRSVAARCSRPPPSSPFASLFRVSTMRSASSRMRRWPNGCRKPCVRLSTMGALPRTPDLADRPRHGGMAYVCHALQARRIPAPCIPNWSDRDGDEQWE
ncbi:carboxymuconolactone decarboxylase family protein [Oleiagrimonas soli]|uniref:Carboxymuconolactone decarboxylase-like domain-containing protein n=1 Tax=Oleiagrimonas soli TaxID=1543381 RepID=A0A841KD05_9GAMM|nr:hypothetical protein [Oleiagrimonas soli]MBB6183072.1 hypothetical protein [Oleiagrimonas soli]